MLANICGVSNFPDMNTIDLIKISEKTLKKTTTTFILVWKLSYGLESRYKKSNNDISRWMKRTFLRIQEMKNNKQIMRRLRSDDSLFKQRHQQRNLFKPNDEIRKRYFGYIFM